MRGGFCDKEMEVKQPGPAGSLAGDRGQGVGTQVL